MTTPFRFVRIKYSDGSIVEKEINAASTVTVVGVARGAGGHQGSTFAETYPLGNATEIVLEHRSELPVELAGGGSDE